MPRDGKINRSGSAATLEPDELKNLFDELDDPYRAIAQFCYLTAGRIGEVLSLKGGHIRGGYVVFPGANTKTGKTRRVTMTDPLEKVLERVSAAGYLFPAKSGSGQLTARAVEKHVKGSAALLGYDGVSLHSFRRSRLPHLHEQGWGLHELRGYPGISP